MKSKYVLIHAAPIKHYGIKGQKKGVRRFQLDNGELTAAGKTRYKVGTSGNRPYSTPYSEPQDTASGRKKNVTGSITGASVNKSSGINSAKALDSAYATMAKAIDPAEKAIAKAEAQRKKQEEVNIKRNNAIESAAYNTQTKYGDPKSKHAIASGTVNAIDKAVRTVSGKSKDNNKPEIGRKKNITGSVSGAIVNKFDNGEPFTKKEKLVKIKTAKGIKRR